MGTRAVIGRTTAGGRWRGVWNHWDGQTGKLGRALIDRVAELRGDLASAVRQIVDDVPEGWSSFYLDNRGEDGAIWTGTWSGETANFDGELPDASYLYLFDVGARRLRVFEVDDGPCTAFTGCAFDAEGRATPERLQPTDDDDDDDEGDDGDDEQPSPEQLLEAAKKALGAHTFEVIPNANTETLELFVVVQAAQTPRERDEVDLASLRGLGIEADDGDELLFPVYYRRDDVGNAMSQRGLTALLGLPEDTVAVMQAALAPG